MKDYAGMALRVVVGAIYLVQAYLALFGSTPRGTAAYLAKVGLPVPTILAVLVIAIHGLGGAMLVLGVWTRLAASLNAACHCGKKCCQNARERPTRFSHIRLCDS